MAKDFSVWHLLNKITDDKEKQDILDQGIDIVTDGYGNEYTIPNLGTTNLVSLNDKDYIKFRYNWATKELEVYFKDLDADNTYNFNSYELVHALNINPEEFIDNPEYWYQTILNDLEEVASFETDIEVKEVIDSYNESITTTDNIYKVEIEIDLIPNNWDLPIDDYVENYREYLNNYYRESTIYGENIIIRFDKLLVSDHIIITFIIQSPLDLSGNDLMNIFIDEVKSYLTDFAETDYTIDNLVFSGMWQES